MSYALEKTESSKMSTLMNCNRTMSYLHDRFSGKLINKKVDISWPPRSPDFAIPNFFSLGSLEALYMGYSPQTTAYLNQLRTTFVRECRVLKRADIIST